MTITVGGGSVGLPTPSALTPYATGLDSTGGTLRPKTGRALGSVAANQALTTILNVTVRSVFSVLFFTVDGDPNVDTQQIKVTVNGNVIHDVTASLTTGSGGIIMLIGDAFYSALSVTTLVADTDGGAVFYGVPMTANSIKIEIATGLVGTVVLRGDLEIV